MNQAPLWVRRRPSATVGRPRLIAGAEAGGVFGLLRCGRCRGVGVGHSESVAKVYVRAKCVYPRAKCVHLRAKCVCEMNARVYFVYTFEDLRVIAETDWLMPAFTADHPFGGQPPNPMPERQGNLDSRNRLRRSSNRLDISGWIWSASLQVSPGRSRVEY